MYELSEIGIFFVVALFFLLCWGVSRLRRSSLWMSIRQRHTLVIHTVFLPEENYMFMEEWLDHHLRLGVEHFCLYDNSSYGVPGVKRREYDGQIWDVGATLNKNGEDYVGESSSAVRSMYLDILERYAAFVDVIPWKPQTGDVISYAQVDAVKDYVQTHSEFSQWTAFVDMDEFIACTRGSLWEELDRAAQSGYSRVRMLQRKYISRQGIKPGSHIRDASFCWPEMSEPLMDLGGEKYIALNHLVDTQNLHIHDIRCRAGRTLEGSPHIHFKHFNVNAAQWKWLTEVKGIPQHAPALPTLCETGILSFPFPVGGGGADYVSDALTILVTTSPSACNPSFAIIRRVLESYSSAEVLGNCALVVSFDGFFTAKHGETLHSKCNQESGCPVAYAAYKAKVKAYARRLFASCTFLDHAHRVCLSTALKLAMREVSTPLVLVVQDDLALLEPARVPVLNILKAMTSRPDTLCIVNLRVRHAYRGAGAIKHVPNSNWSHMEYAADHCERLRAEPTREIKVHGCIFSTCVSFTDQTHFAFRDFYDEYVWKNVPEHDFMEHHLDCGRHRRLLPPGTLWDLGKWDDPCMVEHVDTRLTCDR